MRPGPDGLDTPAAAAFGALLDRAWAEVCADVGREEAHAKVLKLAGQSGLFLELADRYTALREAHPEQAALIDGQRRKLAELAALHTLARAARTAAPRRAPGWIRAALVLMVAGISVAFLARACADLRDLPAPRAAP